MNAIEFAAEHGLKLVPVGSRVTCNPPPTDTDADYLVFVDRDRTTDVTMALFNGGWDEGGSEVGTGGYNDEWRSYRFGDENIILTWNQTLYDYFVAATAVAQRLNLLKKEDRVALFQELEQHWPDLAIPKTVPLDIPDAEDDRLSAQNAVDDAAFATTMFFAGIGHRN